MSKRKVHSQRQIQKIAKRAIQNISDNDFFLEEETSHTNNSAAIICSANANSSEPTISSSDYSVYFTQTNCDAEDNSVLQTLSTNVVLHPTKKLTFLVIILTVVCQSQIKNQMLSH